MHAYCNFYIFWGKIGTFKHIQDTFFLFFEMDNNSIYEINVVDDEQAMTRKSFKVDEDEGDDEETVVLFSKTDEISHELD